MKLQVLLADDHEIIRNSLSRMIAETDDLEVAGEAEDGNAVMQMVRARDWDLVVLDPPSFTRNRASVPYALRGYKEIHLRALKLLKIGGTLATFCCSHHVDAGLFQDTVLSAAFDAHRILRRIATYSQSPDHPIIPMIPETEYLKGFAFEVVK